MQKNYFFLLLITICMLFSTIQGMKRSIQTIHCPDSTIAPWTTLPEEIWIHIIACGTVKNKLSKTCSYLYALASRKNKAILLHGQLRLSPNDLKKFIIYYVDLNENNIVTNLLLHGANPNAEGDHKTSLVNYARRNKNIPMLTMLLNIPNSNTVTITKGKDVIYKLSFHDNAHIIIEQLIPISSREKAIALHYWAKVDNTTNINHDFLSDIEIKDTQKALLYAASHGSVDVVRILLEHEISPNFLSRELHGSPLHAAARRGYTYILKLLVEHGARVNEKDFYNLTPLHCAIKHGYINSVQFLIDAGAPIDTKGGDDNETSLTMAAKYGYIKIIDLLLNNHADVNEKILFGNTALHYAVDYNRINVVSRLLLHPDIEINTQNDNYETPLDNAFEKDLVPIINLLLKHSKEVDTRIKKNELQKYI